MQTQKMLKIGLLHYQPSRASLRTPKNFGRKYRPQTKGNFVTETQISDGPGEAYKVLDAATAAGWTKQDDELGNVWCTAPAGHARLTFQPESREYANGGPLWKVEAADHTGGLRPRRWTATFTGQVPATLITAFIKAMTTPDDD
jgi:Domain of unknown function (DUF317)